MVKVVIFILSTMETHQDAGRVVNALQAAAEFKEAGDDVEIIFDGGGTVSAVALANPEHRLHGLYTAVEDKVAGLCDHCARAFQVSDKAQALGLSFLAEFQQHPSLRKRVAQGYQVLTF